MAEPLDLDFIQEELSSGLYEEAWLAKNLGRVLSECKRLRSEIETMRGVNQKLNEQMVGVNEASNYHSRCVNKLAEAVTGVDRPFLSGYSLKNVEDEAIKHRSEIEQRDAMIGKLREYVDWLETVPSRYRDDKLAKQRSATRYERGKQLRAAIGRRDDGTWIEEGEGAKP